VPSQCREARFGPVPPAKDISGPVLRDHRRCRVSGPFSRPPPEVDGYLASRPATSTRPSAGRHTGTPRRPREFSLSPPCARLPVLTSGNPGQGGQGPPL
jgi:hypothetical protein